MQSIIPGQVSFIPVIVLIIAIAAIILILLLMKVYQVKHAAVKKDRPETWDFKPQGDSIAPLSGIPGVKHEKISEKKHPEEDVPLADLGDITKNLRALTSKYHLDAITLSTADGLMIASTSENGQDDAAHYGQVIKPGITPQVLGIMLFSITHKGSTVIGIIRSGQIITDSSLRNIKNDTEKIMSWWL